MLKSKQKTLTFEDFHQAIAKSKDKQVLASILKMLGIQKEIALHFKSEFCSLRTQDSAKKLYNECYSERQKEEKLKRNEARHEAFKKKLEKEQIQRDTKTKEYLSKPKIDVKKALRDRSQKLTEIYNRKRAAVLQRQAEQKDLLVGEEYLRMSSIEVFSNQQKLTKYDPLPDLLSYYNYLVSQDKLSSPEKQQAFVNRYLKKNIPEDIVKSVWKSLSDLTGSKPITEAYKEQIKNNEYGILETICHFIAKILSLGYVKTQYEDKKEIGAFGSYLATSAEQNASGVSF